MINITVEKSSSESTASVMRRFTKRMRDSGILRRVRSNRYCKRKISKLLRKRSTLKRMAKKEHYEELVKLGKVPEQQTRRRRR